MRAAVRNTSSFPRAGTASSARHWATTSWRSRCPEGGSNPAVDLAICHDAVAWSGHRFIVNLCFNQTATLVLTSAFQGVPPLAGERFAGVGTVESAAVVTDRDTGRSRGFGFVEMATAEDAAEAVKKFNGQNVDGRTLKVELANPSGSGGGRGGGGRRGGGGGG